VLNQGSANTVTPHFWFDEETIQLRISIPARKDGSKPFD